MSTTSAMSMLSRPHDSPKRARLLADPALSAALGRFVRARVPASEVDDIVQATLADALSSTNAPDDDAELAPWVYGIARNKVFDFFRRARREMPAPDSGATENVAAADSAPVDAEDLLRWAKRELPEGEGAESTLEWMLREGHGEKLETIAAEANVPAPRVRQRVARMRKHFRARWAAQIAAALALSAVVVLLVLWLARREKKSTDVALPEPPLPAPSSVAPAPASPERQPEEIRRAALERCDAKDWRACIDGLDAARDLDAAGEDDARVKRARRAAQDALAPKAPSKVKTKPKADSTPTATPSPLTKVMKPIQDVPSASDAFDSKAGKK
jgi:DNA-directed RNA polymerase specialized sigma24 family protein